MTFGFLISRLAGTAYMSSGVLILGLFSTPAAVAAYSLAEQCYRAMTSAFNPIVQALYPHMAKEKNLLLLGKVTMGCAMLAVFGAVLGYILAPHLIPLVFGKSWDGVIPVLNVFFMAITVDVLNALSGYPLGAALGNLKVANRTAVYGAIVYLLVAGVLLILRWDTPVAFAWLTIVSLAYVLAHRAFVLGPAIYHARAQHGN
jgi:PST family polysaccharide transporter